MNAPWYRAIATASLLISGACTGDVTEDPSITGSSSGGDVTTVGTTTTAGTTTDPDSSGGTTGSTGPGTTGPTTGVDASTGTKGDASTGSTGDASEGGSTGTTEGTSGGGSGSGSSGDTTTSAGDTGTGTSGSDGGVGTSSDGGVGTSGSGGGVGSSGSDGGVGTSSDGGVGTSGSDGGVGSSGESGTGAGTGSESGVGTGSESGAGTGSESGTGSDSAVGDGGVGTTGGDVSITITDGGGSSSDGGTTGGMIGDMPIFTESFDGNDGDPWPAPWMIVGDNVLSATIQNGRGELSGITGGTARMVLPGFDLRDAEMYASITFSDWDSQGFGLYARQNGGSLDQTDPPGQGYALFLEGFYLQSLGIWHEVAGMESLSSANFDPIPGGLQPDTVYRMRYQVMQVPEGTQLRGKVWLATDPEPTDWFIDIVDTTPELQDLTGSFAVDLYNWAGVDSVWVDDVEIYAL